MKTSMMELRTAASALRDEVAEATDRVSKDLMRQVDTRCAKSDAALQDVQGQIAEVLVELRSKVSRDLNAGQSGPRQSENSASSTVAVPKLGEDLLHLAHVDFEQVVRMINDGLTELRRQQDASPEVSATAPGSEKDPQHSLHRVPHVPSCGSVEGKFPDSVFRFPTSGRPLRSQGSPVRKNLKCASTGSLSSPTSPGISGAHSSSVRVSSPGAFARSVRQPLGRGSSFISFPRGKGETVRSPTQSFSLVSEVTRPVRSINGSPVRSTSPTTCVTPSFPKAGDSLSANCTFPYPKLSSEEVQLGTSSSWRSLPRAGKVAARPRHSHPVPEHTSE